VDRHGGGREGHLDGELGLGALRRWWQIPKIVARSAQITEGAFHWTHLNALVEADGAYPVERVQPGRQPVRHRRLREPTPRAVPRDHFGLGAGEGRVLSQHRLGDGAVQVSPPFLEQRFIRRILDKRMVEGDLDGVILATLAGEARVAQAPQAAFNVGVIGRDGWRAWPATCRS